MYKGLWFFFEINLFVLVGVSVDVTYAIRAGFMPLVVILGALIFWMMGVFISTLFTNLDKKEKLFTIMAYLPKTTVQASIGGIALSAGLGVDSRVLSVAVLSVLITASLGGILIDLTYKKLLTKVT